MKQYNLILAGLAVIAMPHFAFAAKATGNVQVEADQMEIIDTEQKTIFTGNVISTRPSETIKSDEMVVTNIDVKQPDGTLKSVTDKVNAKGNVVITTKTQTITGTLAVFNVQANTLEVTGAVRVVQGSTNLTGNRLVVNLDNNHLQMTGGKERVKANFVPK
jgi:lipopolysaccharide export system protein LptA